MVWGATATKDSGFLPTAPGLAALCLLLALAGCGGGNSPAPPAPAITSFTAAAPILTQGAGTTLTGVFINGTGTVDQGVGALTRGVAKDVDPAATLTYTLTVSGPGGTATAQAEVQVVAPPATPTITAPATVTAGAQGQLATVPAQDGASYAWTITGGTLTGGATASQATFTADTGSSLQLGCVVSNAAGTPSEAASATVAVVPMPVITHFGSAATGALASGASTTLTAVFTGGTGSVSPTLGTVTSGTPVATGSLTATTTYTLTVTTTAGSKATATTTVNVLQAPVITVQPQNLTVTAGQPAVLTVTATGTAPLTYQWQRGATAIPGATASLYTTPAATLGDSGASFQVLVSNAQGTLLSSAATLTVSSGPLPVSVTVQAGAPGLRLAAGLAGFSYEKSKLQSTLFEATDTGLLALFQRLGPGILRVGGNSVDQTTWTPGGAGSVSGQIAPPDVDRLAGFLRACGWKVLYGLNFATNSEAGMALEAAYAATSLGDRLYGFELGNECDLYHSNGLRPASYTFANFQAEWQGYRAAVQAKVPGAVFTGPASAYNVSGYTAPFAKAEGQGLQLLTQHYYRANGQSPTSTIELLLAGDPSLPAELQALDTAAAGIPGGYRLAEANSFYNGGAPNVSDAYGTALWAIDFLFLNALNGSTGVNFHGGGAGTGYTPIADNGSTVVMARPEYYGMDLVSLAGPGDLLATTVGAGGLSFSAYAVASDAGPTRVVLVNKDPGQVAQVSLTLPAAATTAALTLLTGTNLHSPTGTLLDGATLNADGTWTPQAVAPVTVNGTALTLTVAPASAVLAQIQ